MKIKFILLALLAFLTSGAVCAWAETAIAPAPVKTAAPANMSDAALANYISSRLEPLLKDTGYAVTESCDASGCAVVVQ